MPAGPGRAIPREDAGSRRRRAAGTLRTDSARVSTTAHGPWAQYSLTARLSWTGQLGLVDRQRSGAEQREGDLVDRLVLVREAPAFQHRDLGGELHGVSVYAAA